MPSSVQGNRCCWQRCSDERRFETRNDGKELVALLGRPIRFRGNQIKFEWWSKRPMTKVEIAQETKTFKDPVTRPYWDVHDTIEVVMRESVVAEFEIQHTVTY